MSSRRYGCDGRSVLLGVGRRAGCDTRSSACLDGASERGHSVGTVSNRFQLPLASDAVIPTEKLVAYALDPDHPRGRHKARVFTAALGIRKPDWQYLRDQILEAVVDAEVRGTRITPHGVLYDVLVLVDGLNGATQRVATIWLVAGDRPPRLVSTWVDIP